MHFVSLLRASLVVLLVVASIVSRCDAASKYVNGATIFGRCANFSIQAGTAVSFNGGPTSVGTGSVGVAPGTAITGNFVQGTGFSEACTAPAIDCTADELISYGYLKGITCTNTLANSDLAGITLSPGVYCTGSGFFTLTAGNLYLDAEGDANAQFIFQTATTVITSANTKIILLNGALVKNIYWQVGTSVTLGLGSSFMGQILAYVSITVGGGVTVVGRLYAQAAVSCAGNDSITLPSQW
ncbi:hypothetical protein I4U23_016493 [Adineta vaga]|nr:hypothetical protein I4U23_016493 [Adineta vaga]